MHSVVSTSKRQHHVADIEHVLTFDRYQAADTPLGGGRDCAGSRRLPVTGVYTYNSILLFFPGILQVVKSGFARAGSGLIPDVYIKFSKK